MANRGQAGALEVQRRLPPSLSAESRPSDVTFAMADWINEMKARLASFPLALALATLFAACAAEGRDLNVLTRIAYAAFLADQGAAVCASTRLEFSTDDTAAFKSTRSYIQTVREKVSENLSVAEASTVFTAAADQAKREAQEAFRPLMSDGAIRRWCTENVAPMIRAIVGAYERNAAQINEIISNAKRD